MLENRFVRRIFGPKLKKKRKTHCGNLLNNVILVLCPSTNIRVVNPWRKRMGGHVTSIGEGGYAYRTFNKKT